MKNIIQFWYQNRTALKPQRNEVKQVLMNEGEVNSFPTNLSISLVESFKPSVEAFFKSPNNPAWIILKIL